MESYRKERSPEPSEVTSEDPESATEVKDRKRKREATRKNRHKTSKKSKKKSRKSKKSKKYASSSSSSSESSSSESEEEPHGNQCLVGGKAAEKGLRPNANNVRSHPEWTFLPTMELDQERSALRTESMVRNLS